MLRGRVELDSHVHDFVDWCHLWNYIKNIVIFQMMIMIFYTPIDWKTAGL